MASEGLTRAFKGSSGAFAGASVGARTTGGSMSYKRGFLAAPGQAHGATAWAVMLALSGAPRGLAISELVRDCGLTPGQARGAIQRLRRRGLPFVAPHPQRWYLNPWRQAVTRYELTDVGTKAVADRLATTAA